MSRGVKKTHKDYLEELFDKEIIDVPLEDYKGADVPIYHECIRGHVEKRAPSNVIRNFKCPSCVNNKKIDTIEYKRRLSTKNPQFTLKSEYINTDTPVDHLCRDCGFVWNVAPKYVVGSERRSCPKCSSKSIGFYSEKLFKNNPSISNLPAILYCIVLVNCMTLKRECIKIGITQGTSNKDVLKRAKGFTGYEPRIQKLVYGGLEDIFYLEQYLHELWSNHRYTDSHKFGGYSELFEISKLSEILKSIPKNV